MPLSWSRSIIMACLPDLFPIAFGQYSFSILTHVMFKCQCYVQSVILVVMFLELKVIIYIGTMIWYCFCAVICADGKAEYACM